MSVVMLLALLLQAVSIILLRRRLGKTWLRRPVTILVLMSVVYQGVSPVLLCIPSIRAQDVYRLGITQSRADDATLLLAAVMLAFTFAYLLTCPERADAGPPRPGVPVTAPDWRLLALCCAPLALLTYEGRGYNDAVATGPGTAVGTELASSFFVILIALTAFSLVLAKGPGWFLPVLLAQSFLLAAAGERIPVLADAIVLCVLLCRARSRPRGSQVLGAVVLTTAAVLAITAVRAHEGRSLYYQHNGLGARLSALASGVSNSGAQSSQQAPGLVAAMAVRADAVDFTAGILQARGFGQPLLSPSYVPESWLVAVPSALWPSKIANNAELYPVPAEVAAFGLQQVNFLPGLPGMYAGILSPAWLGAFMACLGALAGWGERWLLRAVSPGRLIMLGGSVGAALSFEAGLQGILVELRTAGVLALAVTVAARLGVGWKERERARIRAGVGLGPRMRRN